MIDALDLIKARLVLDEPYIVRSANFTYAKPEKGGQRVFISGMAMPPCAACGEPFHFSVALTVDELSKPHKEAVSAVVEAIQDQYERAQTPG